MAEPTTPTLGLVFAGTGAAFLSSLGLETGPLFWATVGATIGLSTAVVMSRARAIVVFLSVVLICSLFGAWLAVRYFGGEQLSKNAFACLLALFFHPLVSLVLTKLPALWDAVVQRWVGVGAEKP